MLVGGSLCVRPACANDHDGHDGHDYDGHDDRDNLDDCDDLLYFQK